MAIVVPNPDNIPGGITTGYQRQNQIIFMGIASLMNINVSLTTGSITFSIGSIFELNGNLVKVLNEESVGDLSIIPNNSFFWVYAYPYDNENVIFRARTTPPDWSETKYGYYDTDGARALLKGTKNSNGQIIGVEKMSDIVLSLAPPPMTGGVQVLNRTVRGLYMQFLEPGWYRFEMSSGLGKGNGSNGTAGSSSVYGQGGGGGIAATGITLAGGFFTGGDNVQVFTGGNGFTGGRGSNAASRSSSIYGGNGGGSGAGEESYIIINNIKYDTGKIRGGYGGTNDTVINYSLLDNNKNDKNITNGSSTNSYNHVGNNTYDITGKTWTSETSSDLLYTNFGNGTDGNNSNGGLEGGGNSNTKGKSNFNGWGGGGDGASQSNGGKGGGGGAPGWYRDIGDSNAGYVRIFKLS